MSINWLKGTRKEKTLIYFILLTLMLIYFCKKLFTLKVKYFGVIKSWNLWNNPWKSLRKSLTYKSHIFAVLLNHYGWWTWLDGVLKYIYYKSIFSWADWQSDWTNPAFTGGCFKMFYLTRFQKYHWANAFDCETLCKIIQMTSVLIRILNFTRRVKSTQWITINW